MAYISICIPAYKRTDYLKRLLESIKIQSYRDFEVILTDDSPDQTAFELASTFKADFDIKYIKNPKPLGTPENWNEGIRNAKGVWIKMMHDDDWFTSIDSLQEFVNHLNQNKSVDFVFCAFNNVVLTKNSFETVRCSFWDLLLLRMSPLHLFKRVYVGNPSCTLIRNNSTILYDNKTKFVVDFEYYIRCFQNGMKWSYIDKPLLSIGFHDEQVTKYTFQVASVQIPENLWLLRKMGARILYNFIVYDYYWRMFRNLEINSSKVCSEFSMNEPIHPLLITMMHIQAIIPKKLLFNGFFSKVLSFSSYVFSLLRKH